VGAWYLLAENAHGDIPRINAIVRNVYRAMGDPGAEVVFEEERTADTDFNEVEESMSVNKSGENAAMTALVVGMSIIEHTYPASLAKKRHLEECLAFLQAETERQQSIRKSPYRHTLYRLTREFEIAVEDLGPVRKKVAEFVLAEIRRTGKRGKLDAGRIEAELDAVLKVMKEGDKRRAWLQRFRDEFDKVYDRRRLFRHDPKKDRVNVDRTYAFIVQKQIDAIRSKGRKFKAEAAKFQEAYKAYIEASVDKAG